MGSDWDVREHQSEGMFSREGMEFPTEGTGQLSSGQKPVVLSVFLG